LKTHLVIPDPHAHYKHHNDRATWAGKLINDIKPDVVVVLGDTADMPSLSGYDKGKKSFYGRTYRADIDAHADFQERLWSPVRRSKRKMPRAISLIGNHEHRITRAIEVQPELERTIGLQDLELERYYDDIVEYSGGSPGTIAIDGIHYGHFFVSGISGRPIGGEHPAYSLLSKGYSSHTQGHSHTLDFCFRARAGGERIYGLVAGCFQDYDNDWSGKELGKLWWRGVVVKRSVEAGAYSPQFISIEELKKEYGQS